MKPKFIIGNLLFFHCFIAVTRSTQVFTLLNLFPESKSMHPRTLEKDGSLVKPQKSLSRKAKVALTKDLLPYCVPKQQKPLLHLLQDQHMPRRP